MLVGQLLLLGPDALLQGLVSLQGKHLLRLMDYSICVEDFHLAVVELVQVLELLDLDFGPGRIQFVVFVKTARFGVDCAVSEVDGTGCVHPKSHEFPYKFGFVFSAVSQRAEAWI